MNQWDAIRQQRQRGSRAIAYYTPRDGQEQSIKCGMRPNPILKLIYLEVGNEPAGGIDGANALFDDMLGPIVPVDFAKVH